MGIAISANYNRFTDFELGFYIEKEPKYQNRYKRFEVVAIKGHQTCIINNCDTMEIIHTGFLEEFIKEQE